MKNLFQSKSLVMSFCLMAAASAAISSPALAAAKLADGEKEINVGVNEVFIPSGFDSSSDVNVIASGLFPNSCYRWSRADVQKPESGIVEIRSQAIVRSGMCLMVLVPFTHEIQLGRLGKGEHHLRFISADGTYLEKRIVLE